MHWSTRTALAVVFVVLAARANAWQGAPSIKAPGSPSAGREIAITFDDLPKVVPQPAQLHATNQTYLSLSRIVHTLAAHQAPAIGFVVGSHVDGPDRAANLAMLRMWLNAGLTLGNHSYSHPNLCESTGNLFSQDVQRGFDVVRSVSATAPEPKYSRFPYLCTGRDRAEKQRFSDFLQQHGWVNAPVTIEPGDYMFNALYVSARKRNDAALVQRIRDEYLARVGTLLAYFEGVSRDLFHREIRQVLLIHSNDLNTDCLDDLLRLMERRGYRFITLERALEDPAYRTPDNYIGTLGISWLHRWKIALGKPFDLSRDPPIPGWLVSEVEKLNEVR